MVSTYTYLELLALKDVTVSTAGLSWPAADGSVKATSGELSLKERVDLGLYIDAVKVSASRMLEEAL